MHVTATRVYLQRIYLRGNGITISLNAVRYSVCSENDSFLDEQKNVYTQSFI